MADEEPPESPEQKPEEPEAPTPEETPAEEPPAEEALSEDAATEAEQPEPEPAPDPDTPGSAAEDVAGGDSEEASGSDSEPDPEVALAADAAAEGEESTPESASKEAPADSSKGADLPPGADLEPIAVEPDAKLSTEERARIDAEAEERASREAALVTDGTEEDAAARAPAQMESGSRYVATGKRKRSIARVILTPGEGKIEINQRTLEEYFPRPLHQTMARQPLASAGYEENVDVRVRVHGGGISGQAGAVRHGIARALTEIDPELRGDLKRKGFLTRDARVKERRKAGLKKARKKPQFSKR